MDILKTSDNYLNALYLKTKNNFEKGYDEIIIAKILGLNDEQANNIKNYLRKKGLIENSRYKKDDKVILTSSGFDKVLKEKENKVIKLIKFKSGQYLAPTGRASIDFLYYYDIIDEKEKVESKSIAVSISDVLSAAWAFNLDELKKVLLQFAKDKIIEKLKDGTLNNHEELILLMRTHSENTLYKNPNLLIEPEFAEYEVEIGQPLNVEIKENKLAASIIETRDNINAVFYHGNKAKLLLLNEERNLLDFFKSANTEEEFSHRIASLSEVARNLNIDAFRKITQEKNTELKTIQQLEIFLEKHGKGNEQIINTLKSFGRIRQGYPIHTDIAGVVEGLAYFNIKYPIGDYEQTWTILLSSYLNVLKQLYEILADLYLKKQ